jgi:hypothetical protein
MTSFKTTNMARFTWKRLKHGVIVLRSIPTTIEYYKAFQADGWQRWTVGMNMRATARKAKRLRERTNDLYLGQPEERNLGLAQARMIGEL